MAAVSSGTFDEIKRKFKLTALINFKNTFVNKCKLHIRLYV